MRTRDTTSRERRGVALIGRGWKKESIGSTVNCAVHLIIDISGNTEALTFNLEVAAVEVVT